MASYSISSNAGSFEYDYLLDAAEDNDIKLKYSCRAGACSSCLCFSQDTGKYDDSGQSFLSSKWRSVGFFLSCVTTPKDSMSFVEYDERLLSILDPSLTAQDSNGAAMWRTFLGMVNRWS